MKIKHLNSDHKFRVEVLRLVNPFQCYLQQREIKITNSFSQKLIFLLYQIMCLKRLLCRTALIRATYWVGTYRSSSSCRIFSSAARLISMARCSTAFFFFNQSSYDTLDFKLQWYREFPILFLNYNSISKHKIRSIQSFYPTTY